MAEQLTLTAAQSVPSYVIDSLQLDWSHAFIKVVLHNSIGDVVTASYKGAVATTLMVALNKTDLSTQSLQNRVLSRLVADGKLPAGTVTGTPD